MMSWRDHSDGPRPRRPHRQESPYEAGYRERYRRPASRRAGGGEPVLFRRLGLRTQRQELYFLLILVSSALAWYLTPLSDYVAEYVLETVPIDSDVELGREAWRSLRAKYPPVHDVWDVERLGNELVRKLNSECDYRYSRGDSGGNISPAIKCDQLGGYRWSFGVVHADFANAFALPGGIVRVTDSLLRQIRPTEAELAGLLSHEMGHVLRRHSQRREVKKSLTGTVLRALTYEDNDGYDETFGEAVGEVLLKGAAWLGEMGFSRRDEYEADAAAWDVLVASETYDPRGMQGMLSKLWSLEGGSGETRWESTHPGTADRIEALQEKWDALDWQERRKLSKYPKG